MVTITKVKYCTKCGEIQPISKFYKRPLALDSLRSNCKTCVKKYQQAHKAKIAKRKKKHYQAHKIDISKQQKIYRQTLKGYLHRCFDNINSRCNDSKRHNYNRYGGRGIKCLFKNANEFIDYVINKLRINPHGLQIDRINNDGNYEPGNIRFVTHKENCKNR